MLLFYNDHCGHCRMLLETIKRYDSRGHVRLVCLDELRAAGRPLPPQLHTVPCLYVREEKRYLYGKGVFDFLLLPASGKLVAANPSVPSAASAVSPPPPDEPAAFSLGSATLEDAFSHVETDPQDVRPDRAFPWASIEDMASPPVQEVPSVSAETRTKKTLPDIESIRNLRETQLSTGFAS